MHFPALGLSCLEWERPADKLGEARTRWHHQARLQEPVAEHHGCGPRILPLTKGLVNKVDGVAVN